MKTALSYRSTAARLLLGLLFTVFGLNFFLHFLPQPPMAPEAAAFAGALFASGYIFPVIKSVEVIAGLMLLSNRFVPLALALLAPVIVGAVGFHLALDPAGSGAALLALTLELYVAWTYRHAFLPMLQARTEPARVTSAPPHAAHREVLRAA